MWTRLNGVPNAMDFRFGTAHNIQMKVKHSRNTNEKNRREKERQAHEKSAMMKNKNQKKTTTRKNTCRRMLYINKATSAASMSEFIEFEHLNGLAACYENFMHDS